MSNCKLPECKKSNRKISRNCLIGLERYRYFVDMVNNSNIPLNGNARTLWRVNKGALAKFDTKESFEFQVGVILNGPQKPDFICDNSHLEKSITDSLLQAFKNIDIVAENGTRGKPRDSTCGRI